jgi:AcrR family transcriptional regulator
MSDSKRSGPKGASADVRAALLAAGCAVYEERGLDGVSLREVAQRAGVNQAMVRYYFTDKNGFEKALLDDGFKRLLSKLPADGDFEALFCAATSAMNDMPWMPLLMMRTVYISDSQRQYFVETYAPQLMERFGGLLPGDSKFDLLSTVSMLVLPQLGRRVVGPMLGIDYDNQFAHDYAAHVDALLGNSAGS